MWRGAAGVVAQPLDGAGAEVARAGRRPRSCRRRPRSPRARRRCAPTSTSTPSSSSTRATARAPSGPALSGSIGVDVVGAAGRAAATATAATSPRPISSGRRLRARNERRGRPGRRRVGRASSAHQQVVVEGEHAGRPARRWPAGRRTGPRRRAVPPSCDPVARRCGNSRAERRRPTSWAVAPGASASRPRSTWRTASARKPVDHRLLEAARGQRGLGAGAQLVGADHLVGEHGPLVVRASGRCAGPGRPASRAAPTRPTRMHHRRERRQRRRLATPRRGRLPTCALEPVEDPLQQVLLVVLRAQQLAAQLGAGLVRSGSSGGSGSRSSTRRGSPGESRPAASARRRRPPCASAGRGTAARSPPEVNGVTNAAETTCASAWLTMQDEQRVLRPPTAIEPTWPTSEIGTAEHVAGDAHHDAR